MRLDFDLFAAPDAPDPIVVVTAIAGRAGDGTLEDEEFGEIELPDQVPSEEVGRAAKTVPEGAAGRRHRRSGGGEGVHRGAAGMEARRRDAVR